MPVLKIKEDGEWKKVSNVNMLSVGSSGGSSGYYEDVNEKYY